MLVSQLPSALELNLVDLKNLFAPLERLFPCEDSLIKD